LGMLWEGSVSWCELFVESDKRFERTDKFIRAPETWAIAFSLLLSVAIAGLSFKLLWLGTIPLALGLGFAALVVFGSAMLRWNLHSVRQRTVSSAPKVSRASLSSSVASHLASQNPKHKSPPSVRRLNMIPS